MTNPTPQITRFSPSRRKLLIGSGAILIGATVGARYILRPSFAGAAITPEMAFAQAQEGAITLIDIRTPREWDQTGSGQGAHRVDLRRDDFNAELQRLVGGNKDAPIALICARGVRSARLADQLQGAGFTNIIDIPQGMLGSNAGPGWIKSGLPLTP